MKKFLFSSLIFCLSLFIIFFEDFSLVASNIFQNPAYFLGKDENITRYNEALFLAKKWDFLSAKSLASPLLNAPDTQNPGDISELYADILYKTDTKKEDILLFYNKALSYDNANIRIKKKIEMLSASGWNISENLPVQNTVASWSAVIQSGSSKQQEKEKELQILQQNRKGSVNFSSNPSDAKDFVDNTLRILEGEAGQKDW